MRKSDVVVIGGSVAGLQAALTLGRARRRVVLVDDGRPRNRPARHVHNFLGHPAPSPADLLAAGRNMVAGYDVERVEDRVETVTPRPGADPGPAGDPEPAGHPEPAGDPRFTVITRGGARWSTRSVVLATGLTDELPDIPGVAREWGDRVVACPHCHGWEVRDQPLGQLGMRGRPALSTARAVLLSRWSEDVSLFTDGDDLDAGALARLSAAGVRVRTEPVLGVRRQGDGMAVELAGGGSIPRRALFVAVRQHQQTDLAARLGCRLTADGPNAGGVAVDDAGRTGVPGVWAAGTTALPGLLAIGAAGHASTVAVAVHADLIERDLAGAAR
jgi:thioredoxin reductase (NADPH)